MLTSAISITVDLHLFELYLHIYYKHFFFPKVGLLQLERSMLLSPV